MTNYLPDAPRRAISGPYWTLAAITVLAAALRLYRLDYQSLWHDEAISVIVARAPLQRFLEFFRADGPLGRSFEYNPPLYELLLHGWFAVFGVGGYQARLLSAVAGVVSVPLVFALGARLFGSSAGLCAAFLLAISQLGVMFSQEARNYELFLLLALVTANLYLMSMTSRSVRAWCLTTASAALMLLTNYYGVFVVLALAVYTAIYWRSIPLRWVVGSAIAGSLAFLPWLAFALAGQVHAASHRVQPEYFSIGLARFVGTIHRFGNGATEGLLQSTPKWTLPVGGLLFIGPILLLIARASRRHDSAADGDRRATALALLLLAVPLLSVAALGVVFHVQYDVRYVALCIAPYYMLVGAGMTRLPTRTLRGLALIAVACYSGYALRANYQVPYKENYRDAIAFVASQAEPDDCYAFVASGAPPLEWSIYATYDPKRLLKMDGSGVPADSCHRTWVITYERLIVEAHRRWSERIAAFGSDFVKRAERRFFWVSVDEYQRGS